MNESPRLTVMLLLALSGTFATRTAQADSGCGEALTEWARGCAESESFYVAPAACLRGHILLNLSLPDSDPLHVDITRTDPRGFVIVGDMSLSPVGNYEDWSLAPRPARVAFEKLVSCFERAAPPGDLIGDILEPIAAPITAAIPWRLFAGLALAFAVLIMELRLCRRGDLLRFGLPLCGLIAGTFVFRWLTVEPAYHHQNGQGPLWLEYAFGAPSIYGPGYREIFGLVASLSSSQPESAVFTFQAISSAIGPAAVWSITRKLGLAAPLAWAGAVFFALDPMLARLSWSESYVAAVSSMALLAGALLATGSARSALSKPFFYLSCLAAGFLISQAARVHPIGWVPMALLPGIGLVGPGTMKERLARGLSATLLIGGVVALTSLPSLLATLQGDLGAKYLAPESWLLSRLSFPPTGAMAIVALMGLILGWRRPTFFASSVLGVCFFAVYLSDPYANEMAWIQHGYWRLAAIASLGPLAAVFAFARDARPTRFAAVGLVALAIIGAGLFWQPLTALPTDSLEAGLVRGWRDRLPEGARVAYLSRIGDRVLFLPFFGHGLLADRIDGNDRTRIHLELNGYYFRSSLCSTPEGSEICGQLEEDRTLKTIYSAELPARRSKPEMGYLAPVVRVELLRVAGE